MASAWRRVMVYLGLVDDDEYEEYEPYDEPAAVAPPPPPPAPPRRSAISYVEPEGATAGVRTLPREPESNVSVQPRPAPLRPVPAVQTARPYVVAPDGFNDAQGMPLYTFARDTTPGKSACNGPCATAWPPLPATATDKDMGDWTVISRDDGSKQWAYKGQRLYTYAKDTAGQPATGVSAAWPRAK